MTALPENDHQQLTDGEPEQLFRYNHPDEPVMLTVSQYGTHVCVELVDYEEGTVLAHADLAMPSRPL